MKRFVSVLVMAAVVALTAPLFAASEFDALTEGHQIADFRLNTIYENEYGDAIGAEFRHVPSDFVLDILRIQSIPQGFIWVNTPPPTDQGEPHTLEHLAHRMKVSFRAIQPDSIKLVPQPAPKGVFLVFFSDHDDHIFAFN